MGAEGLGTGKLNDWGLKGWGGWRVGVGELEGWETWRLGLGARRLESFGAGARRLGG